MNIFGKIGKFIVKNQEILQQAAIIVAVLIAVLLMVYMYRKYRKIQLEKSKAMSKIEGILEDINVNIAQLRKQGDFIYIDNSTKKNHEQEALEEAMVMAKSDRADRLEKLGNEKTGSSKCLSRFPSEIDLEAKAATVRESMIDKILSASEEAADRLADKSSDARNPRHFMSRNDGVDKHGRAYNLEELERQIRD
ncbi:hypothetical protein ACGCUQ_05495 [Eubacteriales bacterium KG127]